MTKRGLLAADLDYTPFVILGTHRTGSTVLARALNTHSGIHNFGEIFNFVLDFIDYQVEGYDLHSSADRTLRDEDPARFLRERIYRPYGAEVGAVGFKFHYANLWFNEALFESLVAEARIHVVHLRRRNHVRRLVSERIATQTGVWQEKASARKERLGTAAGKLTPAKAVRALTRPSRVLTSLKRTLKPEPLQQVVERESVTLTREEVLTEFRETDLSISNFTSLFLDHPTLDVDYEELSDDPHGTFDTVQGFLGVERQRLRIANRRQNPEPLRELIANYDELRHEFADHPYAWMFEE